MLRHAELKYYSPDDRFVNVTAVSDDIIGIRDDGSIISMKKGEIKKRGFAMFTHGLIDLYNGMPKPYKDVIGLKDDGTIEFLETDLYSKYLPKDQGFVSIASGWSHILALKANGTLYNITFAITNSFGLISNTPKGCNFIAIAACCGNSAALTNDGFICVWGEECDKMRKTYLEDCIDITMSNRIIVGLKSNGDIVKYLIWDKSLSVRKYNYQTTYRVVKTSYF